MLVGCVVHALASFPKAGATQYAGLQALLVLASEPSLRPLVAHSSAKDLARNAAHVHPHALHIQQASRSLLAELALESSSTQPQVPLEPTAKPVAGGGSGSEELDKDGNSGNSGDGASVSAAAGAGDGDGDAAGADGPSKPAPAPKPVDSIQALAAADRLAAEKQAAATAAAAAAETEESKEGKAPKQTAVENEQMLAAGLVMYKHGRMGNPHKRKILVTSDGLMYSLKLNEEKLVPANAINLKTIQKVVRGKTTYVLKRRVARDASDLCCFSVISKEKQLNLQTDTPEQCELWYIALAAKHEELQDKPNPKLSEPDAEATSTSRKTSSSWFVTRTRTSSANSGGATSPSEIAGASAPAAIREEEVAVAVEGDDAAAGEAQGAAGADVDAADAAGAADGATDSAAVADNFNGADAADGEKKDVGAEAAEVPVAAVAAVPAAAAIAIEPAAEGEAGSESPAVQLIPSPPSTHRAVETTASPRVRRRQISPASSTPVTPPNRTGTLGLPFSDDQVCACLSYSSVHNDRR